MHSRNVTPPLPRAQPVNLQNITKTRRRLIKRVNSLLVSKTASWLTGYAFVSCVESLRFKVWTGQIGHSVATAHHHWDCL